MSTMMLAAASGPATPWNVMSRAPMRSPPTCISGNSALVASRTKRMRTQAASPGLSGGGKSGCQPAPATLTVTTRTITTRRIPQPTLATACAMESMPDQMTRPMTTAIPINQAMTPACLMIVMRTASPPSCPALCRASTPFFENKTWMAGTSPAMTNAERQCTCRTASNGARRGGPRCRKLPRLLDVEGARHPETEGYLIGRAALGDERRVGGVIGEPLVFDIDVGRPLRGPEIARLRTGADRLDAAAG